MPVPIKIGTCWRRAVADTFHRLSLNRQLLLQVILFVIALALFQELWGREQAIEQLKWPATFAAAFLLVGLMTPASTWPGHRFAWLAMPN
jgi:hypothetical protein